MICFLQLGKQGDQLSMLPLVHHEFKTSKVKPVLMVSKQYSAILDRVDYVTPRIYDGDWDDLEGALKVAKKDYETVLVTQTHGRKFRIQHRRSSFQLDAWQRAGGLKLWDSLPLVLKRDAKKEAGLLEKMGASGKRFVLFADYSQSSPFLGANEVSELVENHLMLSNTPRKLVRLSQIKLPHLCDFLPLYDAADALITVETAHLHLSRATKTPVLALATDKPGAWNGSAWSKRFAFYCRYGDFQDRRSEFLDALDGALTGRAEAELVHLN